MITKIDGKDSEPRNIVLISYKETSGEDLGLFFRQDNLIIEMDLHGFQSFSRQTSLFIPHTLITHGSVE